MAAFVGQAVQKCGRTSGFTTGNVQAINVTIQVQYSSGVATFVNQIMTPAGFIRFPTDSRGFKLTVRVTVKAKGAKVVLTYWITAR